MTPAERAMLAALMADVDLYRIALLPERPPWWDEAACKDQPEVNWFPERGEPTEPAKQVCDACPARDACLAFAVEEHIEHGIWGGTSGRERRTMRRQRAA